MPLQAAVAAAPPLPPRALRDTLDAVFRTPPYQPGRAQSLWDRLRALWASLVDGAAGALEQPALYWSLVAVLAALAAFGAARMLAHRDGRALGTRGHRSAERRPDGDAWAAAEQAAADGRLHDAAHLTYAAVLDALARRGLLRPHPSRTLGDYARDLRARGAGAHPAFRAFARQYEPFVYGGRGADGARFDALRAAARSVLAASDREAR